MPSAHGQVLAVLAATATPVTGRTVAGLTHPPVSQSRVARILNQLTDSGVVDRTPAGSASLFSLNREHVAAEPIEALASLRRQLWLRVTEHVQGWTHPPVGVVVYGSAARADGDTASDIDLLIVRPSDIDDDDHHWHHDVTDLTSRVMRWSGNTCEVLDRSVDELRAMAADGERLLSDIRRDGRVLVGSLELVPRLQGA